jgi:hypothetical protein
MDIELNTKMKRNQIRACTLVFDYRNELGWFYRSPCLVWKNIVLWWGFMCHVNQHTTNHKCDNLNYNLMQKMTSLTKHCKIFYIFKSTHYWRKTTKFPPIFGTMVSHQNNSIKFIRFWGKPRYKWNLTFQLYSCQLFF